MRGDLALNIGHSKKIKGKPASERIGLKEDNVG